MAEAGNTKVEQIGNVATNYGPLQPVLPSQAAPLTVVACGPNFTNYTYFKGCRKLKHHTCIPFTPVEPVPPICDGWYPTYGYVIYTQIIEVNQNPNYYWCNSSGEVESTPVIATDYNGITNTATRCGLTFNVLGEITP